jgi:hypothetical protein
MWILSTYYSECVLQHKLLPESDYRSDTLERPVPYVKYPKPFGILGVYISGMGE